MRETYSGGIGHKEEPLLNAEQLAGNSYGFGRYHWWVAGDKDLSHGRRLLFAGASSVHNVGSIPPQAVFLERTEVVASLCLQGSAAIKFRGVKRANPGRSFAGMKCHGSTSRGSGTLLLDDLGHLECGWLGLSRMCRRGFCRRRRWRRGRNAGLGRGRSSLL
jgi:hypothetical protein